MFTAFFKLGSGLLDFRFDQNPEEQTTLTRLGPRSMLRVVSGQFKTSMIFRLGYLLSHCVPWTEFVRETLYPQNRIKGNWNMQDCLRSKLLYHYTTTTNQSRGDTYYTYPRGGLPYKSDGGARQIF